VELSCSKLDKGVLQECQDSLLLLFWVVDVDLSSVTIWGLGLLAKGMAKWVAGGVESTAGGL